MKRNILHFCVDALSLLVMLAMVATGLLMRFVLPPGSGGTRTLWQWGRHDWGELHFYLAAALGVLLLVHLSLHWRWVCMTIAGWVRRNGGAYQGGAGRRGVYGLVALIVVTALLGGLLYLAAANVRETEGGRRRHRGGRGEATQQGPQPVLNTGTTAQGWLGG